MKKELGRQLVSTDIELIPDKGLLNGTSLLTGLFLLERHILVNKENPDILPYWKRFIDTYDKLPLDFIAKVAKIDESLVADKKTIHEFHYKQLLNSTISKN